MAADSTGPERPPYWTAERIEWMREDQRQRDADDIAFAGSANRRFLNLAINAHRQWPGVQWINRPALGYPLPGMGRGWGVLPMLGAPTPRFRTRSRKASNLADFCEFSSTLWLLASARCAAVFSRLQPDAVDILPVEVELGDGTVLPAGAYAMIDVINVLPAYDVAASGLEIEDRHPYRRAYLPADFRRVILREEIVQGAHLFRDEVDPIKIWVSVEVRDALRKAGVTSAGFAWPDRFGLVDWSGRRA